MLIHVAQYSLVLWMLVGNNEADIIRLRSVEKADRKMYSIAACTVICLQQNHPNATILQFQNCYDGCEQPEPSPRNDMRKIQENRMLSLLCRDERSLTFVIERNIPENSTQREDKELQQENSSVIYFVRVQSANSVVHSQVYLSDGRIFTLSNLTQQTIHNVSAVAIHANYRYSIIAKEQPYMTLKRGYRPGQVSKIRVQSLREQRDNISGMQLNVRVSWRPATDMTCHYEIVCYAELTNYQTQTKFDIRDLKHPNAFVLQHLSLSSKYSVGIRARNFNDRRKESDLLWHPYKSPDCADWHDHNFTICAPATPVGLVVAQQYLHSPYDYSLNVSWQRPLYQPSYYVLRIFLLRENGTLHVYNMSGNNSHFFVAHIALNSLEFDVHLTAYTPGGNSTATCQARTAEHTDKQHQLNMLTAVLAPAVALMMLLLALCLIFHRRAKLQRYRERCKYFEELEDKAPIDPDTSTKKTLQQLHLPIELAQLQIDLEAKLALNDAMEVQREHIALYEVLGEGAFGLVLRGVYNDAKLGAIEVAVKMLKDLPAMEEVRAFRREIDVMKSVKPHPHIVGIIGHCTRQYNKMLLLTEYCRLGNLLDFLRDECKYLNDLNMNSNMDISNDATKSCSSTFIQRFKRKYRNVGQSQTFQEYTQSHMIRFVEDLDSSMKNQHGTVQRIMTVENQAYFQPMSVRTKEKDLERKPVAACRRPLTAANLLDIAKQAAVGMEFLAKNKVVHRDLAARNVLVTHNSTIKIADFGLSRDVYQENIYKTTGQGKLPIKWLALESMTHQLYTTKSDVWSYGILLYEIVTLGGTPYPSIATHRLLHLLKSGYRMERPKYCGEKLYKLMRSCWLERRNERPTFTQIVQILSDFLQNSNESQLERVLNLKQRYEPLDTTLAAATTIEDTYLKPL